MEFSKEKENKEYEFLKFYLVIKKIREDVLTVNEVELSKELVKYYSNPKYKNLFRGITKKGHEQNNSAYIDLSEGFETACSYGLLTKTRSGMVNREYLVNTITFNRRVKTLEKHTKEEIEAMYFMLSEMKREEIRKEVFEKVKK